MQGPLLEIGDDEVHLWHVDPTAIVEPARLDRYAAWISADEEARRRRFHFERHRHAFLIARALVRGTLARYLGGEPAALRFRIGEHGRPALDPAAHPAAALRFNLSHTDGRAILAIARAEVGVDVERSERSSDLIRIAEHSFAPAEVQALRELTGEALRRRFFATWTLKEAYIKAVGVGISIGLDRFAFAFDDDAASAVTITFRGDLEDDPAAWTFRRLDLGEAYPVALALRRPEGSGLAIRRFAALPGDPLDPPENA